MPQTLMKINQVSAITGHSRSKVYADIKAGKFPPPIRLGTRTVAWADNEINAWITAKIAGKTDDEIRSLVSGIVVSRHS